MTPTFFATQSDFRKWLEKYHNKATELFVGFYKVDSGKPSITWTQSVDEAICFGWIDGVRKSLDNSSYCIRFTPRKPKSIWSAVNIKKVAKLTKQGLMTSAGVAIFEKREKNKTQIYSYEKNSIKLDDTFEMKFKKNKKAWTFFQSQAPSYQKPAINWVMSAKQESTRVNRLQTLINDSEAERKIKQLSYGTQKK